MENKSESRITWRNKFEFYFNVFGYTIGLGNIWRFTYLCFKNGGGAFLIPYTIVALFCGIPLIFMEVALGQLSRRGCIAAWNSVVPMMRGVGYSSVAMSGYFLIYIALTMSWCLIYFVRSFTLSTLPWATCDNDWNTVDCVLVGESNINENISYANTTANEQNVSRINKDHLSTLEFWNGYVLRRSTGIDDLGNFTNWPVFGCFIASWIICYLCIVRGIRTSGNVAYFTVLAPYVLMIALLIKGVTLEGASDGILYFITPDVSRLKDSEVWLDAASQVIFSLALCFGPLIGFGSYNKPNFDCYRCAYIFVGACCASSLAFGFTVFSFLGHMATILSLDIKDMVEGGPGLVFEVLPTEFALLPFGQIWSAIFFLALLGLAIDGSYATIEGCTTALADYLPEYFEGKRSHYWRAVFCFVLMLVGLLQLFDGGIYIFELINRYGASGICILWVAIFEAITIGWIYGIDRFFDDVTKMIGYRPPIFIRHCIKYVTPTFCMAIFIASCVKYSPLKMGNYIYPWWADMIGWLLSASVVSCVPIIAIKVLFSSEGTLRQKWKSCITPIRMQGVEDDCDEKQDTATIA
ncbi:sodium- and chloride-dependent betaine transporter-like isoform X1 [Styela clava]